MALLSIKSIHQLAIALLAGTTILPCLLPQATLAQLTNAQPLQDWQSPEGSRDPFSGKADGSAASFGVLDMIHRANLGGLRSASEFNEEQEESIDAAADMFRKEQLRRLEAPPGGIPTTPPSTQTTPASGN
jgi:hypothetical protein